MSQVGPQKKDKKKKKKKENVKWLSSQQVFIKTEHKIKGLFFFPLKFKEIMGLFKNLLQHSFFTFIIPTLDWVISRLQLLGM